MNVVLGNALPGTSDISILIISDGVGFEASSQSRIRTKMLKEMGDFFLALRNSLRHRAPVRFVVPASDRPILQGNMI